MAKSKNAVSSSNRKLTDWFPSSQPPSSQAPVSSQPSCSPRSSSTSTAKETTPKIKQEPISSQPALIRPCLPHLFSRPTTHNAQRTTTRPMQVATLLKQNRPQPQTQDRTSTTLKSRLSSGRRSMKKENAPPLRDVEVISVTSETPTHISISSASATSLTTSSIVETTPMDSGCVKTEFKNFIDLTASQLARRRSPRLTVRESPKKRRKLEHTTTNSKRSSPKKRRKTQNDKVIASDDEAIDLEGAEDVVYVESRRPPVQKIDLITPDPSDIICVPSPRKRARQTAPAPAGDVDSEVIPSSQSDEREMAVPEKNWKTREDVHEQVLAWQASQEQDDSLASLDQLGPWNIDADDVIYDMDICNRERKDVPLSCSTGLVSPRPNVSKTDVPVEVIAHQVRSPVTERNTQLQTPALSSPVLEASATLIEDHQKPTITIIPPSSANLPPLIFSDTSPITNVEPLTPSSPSPKELSSNLTTSSLTPLSSPKSSPKQVAEDPETRTAKLVAEIKELALAEAASGSEEEDEEISDSDLGSEPELFKSLPTKSKSNPIDTPKRSTRSVSGSEGHSTDDDEPQSDATTQQAGVRRSKRLAFPPARKVSFKPVVASTSSFSRSTTPPPKPHFNPVDKLRKNAAKERKQVKLRAELLDFRLSPDPDDADFGNAVAGPSTPSPGRQQRWTDPSRMNDDVDDSLNIDEEDRRQLMERGHGGLVGLIFKHELGDRERKRLDRPSDGIVFWSASGSGENMCIDTESGIPELECDGEDRLLMLLKERIQAKDVLGSSILLQTASFMSPSFNVTDNFLSWLFSVSLLQTNRLSSAASSLLCHYCSRTSTSTSAPRISISPALRLFASIGVSGGVLDDLQIELPSSHPSALSNEQRSLVLKDFANTVAALGVAMFLDPSDVPTYIALLIATGMDEKADVELRIAVSAAISKLCVAYCGKFEDSRGELERQICAKLIPFSEGLSSNNRILFLSFLNGSPPLVKRIAQWISFSMLTTSHGSELARTCTQGPPALSSIKQLLDAEAQSSMRCDSFFIPAGVEEQDDFDYIQLGHNIEILGHVLMNVPQYVRLERHAKTGSAKTDFLPDIMQLLERLSGKIVDTRAAHPDRSATKAAIQRLKMRLHYQYKESLPSTDERGKARKALGTLDMFVKKGAGG